MGERFAFVLLDNIRSKRFYGKLFLNEMFKYSSSLLHVAKKFKSRSFPRAALSENCSLLETDNVRGEISEHIFAPNGGYCLYICHSRK